MSESHFQQVTRQGLERDIREASEAGDMTLANEKLDMYAYGRRRPDVSLELAHHIATNHGVVDLARLAVQAVDSGRQVA